MDKQQAQDIVRETFKSPFDKGRFTIFAKNILNKQQTIPLVDQILAAKKNPPSPAFTKGGIYKEPPQADGVFEKINSYPSVKNVTGRNFN